MAALFRRQQHRHPVAAFARDHGPTLIAGLGAGAVLAIVVGRGLRGRRHTVERLGGASRAAAGRMSRRARDVRNRTRGMLHQTRGWLRSDAPGDEQLEARVRSQLGHHSRYASRIVTAAEDGVLTLRGEVLAAEVGDVIAGVRAVRGVRDVRNELAVLENEEELSQR